LPSLRWSFGWQAKSLELLLLEGFFVRNGQFLATILSAVGQHPAAVGRSHTLTETVFILSFSLRRLICTLHGSVLLKRAAKMYMFLELSNSGGTTVWRPPAHPTHYARSSGPGWRYSPPAARCHFGLKQVAPSLAGENLI
jgi:hypothetical protein